jgi:hypothetical protein
VKLVVVLPDKPDQTLRDFAVSWNADYNPRAKLG